MSGQVQVWPSFGPGDCPSLEISLVSADASFPGIEELLDADDAYWDQDFDHVEITVTSASCEDPDDGWVDHLPDSEEFAYASWSGEVGGSVVRVDGARSREELAAIGATIAPRTPAEIIGLVDPDALGDAWSTPLWSLGWPALGFGSGLFAGAPALLADADLDG